MMSFAERFQISHNENFSVEKSKYPVVLVEEAKASPPGTPDASSSESSESDHNSSSDLPGIAESGDNSSDPPNDSESVPTLEGSDTDLLFGSDYLLKDVDSP